MNSPSCPKREPVCPRYKQNIDPQHAGEETREEKNKSDTPGLHRVHRQNNTEPHRKGEKGKETNAPKIHGERHSTRSGNDSKKPS